LHATIEKGTRMAMQSVLEAWDGESVIVRYDRPSGAWIFIAVHSTRLGPAVGGTRMKSYPSAESALRDALRLSAGMTYKFAVPGMPFGGGKAVIALPGALPPQSRRGLLLRYGTLVRQLGGLYSTAPDVGTSSADMDVAAETGAPHVFGRSRAAGGSGSSGPATALGVFAGIRVVCESLFGEAAPKGRSVLVQGLGSVGGALVEHLIAAGAEVAFSEVDVGLIRRFRDERGLEFVSGETAHATECDVFAPCALGGVLNAKTIPQLGCRAVCGGANNQLAGPEDAERLRARGILYAPDYVVNVGGAMAGLLMETLDWTRERAEAEVVDRVRRALGRVFEVASVRNITTDAAARRIAEERLRAPK
jgi:glutamate dehydrogenase/leucine dehydrogenase